MNASLYRTTAVKILIAALLPVAAAHAQLGDLLKGATQGGTESSSGGLSGLGGSLGGMSGMPSLQSLSSGSTGNVAGILEYCVKNNYLGGASGAASVKDKLLGKVGGDSPTSDAGYTSGAKGILSSSDGKQFDLSGGGLKDQVTKQVCDKILAQGKSLL
ncbi:DUF2501 domain-containing protein [Cupriavidus basilensis]|uniref:DUF2501 domain-containing protein n=1 Tax=Cupriavidus basilensis TaxID=68895 RepID=UPI0020A622FF|nr:DUF2501 domain-containing protein [Cupriavidus basilensis]MCP3023434.1 DUF2501 domain-containing protein [Cupriavidus basilensis]MDR3383007.1 DUF2501 domain-containing protein [Cupriavidus basilensis]